MFDKMKQLMDMHKSMRQVKQKLEKTVFEVSSPDGMIQLTMNGSQEVKDVRINTDIGSLDKLALEKSVKEAYNKGLKRSHEIAAAKMKEITGLDIPGLT